MPAARGGVEGGVTGKATSCLLLNCHYLRNQLQWLLMFFLSPVCGNQSNKRKNKHNTVNGILKVSPPGLETTGLSLQIILLVFG